MRPRPHVPRPGARRISSRFHSTAATHPENGAPWVADLLPVY